MTRVKTLTAALLAIAVLGAGAFAWFGNAGAPNYAHVESIAEAPYFQDAALLERAWSLPVAAAYDDGDYEYQNNPSFCGPTTASNVIQSLGAPMTQTSVLAGTDIRPILGILPMGLRLDQEAELLREATNSEVVVLRDLDLAAFRAELARSNDPSVRYVVNFHRGPLFGAGHGHFSPILGYLAAEDLVFVGDVNDDFRPFLVPSARLHEAMAASDTATGKPRGLLRIDAAR